METQLELHASATTCHVPEMEFKDLVDGALQRPGWVAVGIVVSLYLWQYYKLLPFSYHIRLILILLNRLLVKTKPFKTASDVSVPTANAICCHPRRPEIANVGIQMYIAPLQEIFFYDRVMLGDMDMNMHMNNAMYNNNLDFCRLSIFLQMSATPLKSMQRVKVANGGVSMLFLKELRFWTPYRIRSKIIAVDNKWMYLAHFFESCSGKVLYAMGVSRMVAKERFGKTIPPLDFFQRANLTVPEDLTTVSNTAAAMQQLLESLQAASGHPPAPPTPAAVSTPKSAGSDESRKDR